MKNTFKMGLIDNLGQNRPNLLIIARILIVKWVIFTLKGLNSKTKATLESRIEIHCNKD